MNPGIPDGAQMTINKNSKNKGIDKAYFGKVAVFWHKWAAN